MDMFGFLAAYIPYAIVAGVLFLIVMTVLAIFLRVVVSTNDVHIVQSARSTVSYGKDQPAGNSYYNWPAWVPIIGVRVIQLPMSVFDLRLESYSAYDKGRVPFVIDIMAFFRIDDSNRAAQRVRSFEELREQLKGIVQGACRSILAKADIDQILEERAVYGKQFTDATNAQLKEWGVVNVKNIELMDIRDTQGGEVISNIMAKKKSLIEMQSRTEVAVNMKNAQTAEITAQREVLVAKQQAEQQIGVSTAVKDREVGVAAQQAQQTIKEQERVTAEKLMAVRQVNIVRDAEITKQAQVVFAEQQKAVAITTAEGQKQNTITIAEGALESAKLNAQAIETEGKATGAAETARLMAPVDTQIKLAKEIGANPGYQGYLVDLRKIEAAQVVGVEQAQALTKADVKIISNVGSPSEGLSGVMDLFTAKGGLAVGAALEAISNTPTGKAITDKIINGKGKPTPGPVA